MRRTIKPDEIIKFLKRNGFILIKPRSGSSHVQLINPKNGNHVTVPYHKGRDLSINVIKSIEKQSGLKIL